MFNSNPPPSTVPYTDYKYPNYNHQAKNITIQPDSGFGFSNIRLNLDRPDTINNSLISERLSGDSLPFNQNQMQDVIRSNGMLFREKYSDYQMTPETNNTNGHIYDEVITKTIARTPLSDLFFSDKNLKHIIKVACKLIRIFDSRYDIIPESQNKNELLIVCRSIFLQTPMNPYENLEQELCRLNQGVLDWIVPRMLVNIQQSLGYVRDKSSQPITIPRPQNVSIEGTKTNKFFSALMI